MGRPLGGPLTLAVGGHHAPSALPAAARLLLGPPARPAHPSFPSSHSPSAQVYDVLNADRVIVEKAALAYLNEWFGGEQ